MLDTVQIAKNSKLILVSKPLHSVEDIMELQVLYENCPVEVECSKPFIDLTKHVNVLKRVYYVLCFIM